VARSKRTGLLLYSSIYGAPRPSIIYYLFGANRALHVIYERFRLSEFLLWHFADEKQALSSANWRGIAKITQFFHCNQFMKRICILKCSSQRSILSFPDSVDKRKVFINNFCWRIEHFMNTEMLKPLVQFFIFIFSVWWRTYFKINERLKKLIFLRSVWKILESKKILVYEF
jgi:hypothetical protein